MENLTEVSTNVSTVQCRTLSSDEPKTFCAINYYLLGQDVIKRLLTNIL